MKATDLNPAVLNRNIATNIRQHRRRREMHQADLAEAMTNLGFTGWYTQTVGNIESARVGRRVTALELWALAAIFEVPMEALLCDPDTGTPPALGSVAGPYRSATATAGRVVDGEAESAWTADKVRGLGVRTDLVTAASVLGLSRTVAYDLAKRGEFPVKLLRVGAKYVVPVSALLAYLDVEA